MNENPLTPAQQKLKAEALNNADPSVIGGAGMEITLGEQKIRISAPRLRDLSDYRGWLRATHLEQAREAGQINRMPEPTIVKLMASVIVKPLTDLDVQESLDSQEGQLHFLWLLCRKHNPQLTEEAFTVEIEKDIVKNMQMAQTALLSFGGTTEEEVAGESEDNANPTGETPTSPSGDT